MPALLRLAHVLRDPQEEQLEARPAEENKAPVFDVWQYRSLALLDEPLSHLVAISCVCVRATQRT